MNSRQRVLVTLQHQEPDRVPFDLGSTAVTGIHTRAYAALRAHLGLDPGDPTIAETTQQLARVESDLANCLEVDAGGVAAFFRPAGVIDAGDELHFHDDYGIGWRMPKDGGLYFDLHEHPLAGEIDEADINEFPWPVAPTTSEISAMRADVERVRAGEGRAVVVESICSGMMEVAAWLRGFEDFYADVALNPSRVALLLDHILERKLVYWDQFLGVLGDSVDVVKESDDLGSQRDLLISPEAYRRLLKPRQRTLFDFIHAHTDARVMLHTCGAVRKLIPDLIEIGVDILNPVQVSAAGMETQALKREFGGDLVFWGGGVDTQHVLCHGSVSEVRDEVRRRLDDLMPGGGFVFSAVHNIQSDVPPANIVAMWETVHEHGVYGS